LFGVLFPLVSVTSLPFFADAGHHALQMLENYGVEGDNLQQAVQETAEGNF